MLEILSARAKGHLEEAGSWVGPTHSASAVSQPLQGSHKHSLGTEAAAQGMLFPLAPLAGGGGGVRLTSQSNTDHLLWPHINDTA